ncbi:MAG: hypothetical protein ACJ76Y_23080 [Thermoanaerobaculia bacterium]
MAEHYSRDELSAFSRGDISAEDRHALMRHLLGGCERCSSELAALLRVEDDGYDAGYDVAIERVRRSAGKLVRKHHAEKARIEESATHLSKDSSTISRPRSRKKKVDVKTVENLLAQSWALRYENPSEMVRYAVLAVKCSEKLDARAYGREQVLDLRGRALAELGNAYRVLDQLDAAEQKLEQATRFLDLGSGDRDLYMRLLEFEASLLAARRRFGRAAIYLLEVYEYRRARGDQHLAGRAMIQRGLYMGYAGNPEQALRLLEEGLSLVDREQEPELVYAAVHNQLHFIIDCGRFIEARTFRLRHSNILSRDNGRLNRARLQELGGRVEAGMGKPDRAEAIFREVKREFEELERPYPASIVGLDLSATLLAQDRPDEAGEVVMQAHRVFKALRINREAVAAVLILFHAIKRGEATVKMVEKVAAYLRLLERDPSARFDPQPF